MSSRLSSGASTPLATSSPKPSRSTTPAPTFVGNQTSISGSFATLGDHITGSFTAQGSVAEGSSGSFARNHSEELRPSSQPPLSATNKSSSSILQRPLQATPSPREGDLGGTLGSMGSGSGAGSGQASPKSVDGRPTSSASSGSDGSTNEAFLALPAKFIPKRKDLLALATLRKEMSQAKDAREELKMKVDEAQLLITNHHSGHALENVTLARKLDDLTEEVAQKQDIVKKYEHDMEVAEREQARLHELNESLLQGIREKEMEKERVQAKLQTFASSEYTVLKFSGQLHSEQQELEQRQKAIAEITLGIKGKSGNHHPRLMALEQTMIDLRLEAESLKAKIQQLSGSAPVPKEGWTKPNYEHLFHPCTNADCTKMRRTLKEAKKRLTMLQTSPQHLSLESRSLAPPSSVSPQSAALTPFDQEMVYSYF